MALLPKAEIKSTDTGNPMLKETLCGLIRPWDLIHWALLEITHTVTTTMAMIKSWRIPKANTLRAMMTKMSDYPTNGLTVIQKRRKSIRTTPYTTKTSVPIPDNQVQTRPTSQ